LEEAVEVVCSLPVLGNPAVVLTGDLAVVLTEDLVVVLMVNHLVVLTGLLW
jgi:hypothetical protein